MRVLPARLRQRLPVRLRQHWNLLAVGVVGVVVALTLFGNVTIRPYSTSSAAVTDEEWITQNLPGTVDLFNGGVRHTITLFYSQDDYDRMLDAYFSQGEKEWMTADLTIDGTTIDSVGIRLKGNSTLSGLVDDRAGSATEGQRAPGGFGGRGRGGGGGGGFGGGGFGAGGGLSTQQPENLPLLVKIDEYQAGRAYQGRTELAIRPTSSAFRTAVNEAVALDLIKQSGQPSQDYAYAGFTVNDRPTTTRLVVVNPDPQYATSLAGSGVLYKVLAGSDFSYQGADQTSYADDFHQVNLVGSQDLQPLVSFLKWLDSASDDEFAEDLGRWVDVSSFATYLATQDVLQNFDSLSGPGRNGYLYYDLDTGLISVVSWDMNLALGAMGGMRGGGPDGAPAGAGGFGRPGGGAMNDNQLVTRFEADPAFAAMIEKQRAELRSSLIDSGRAAQTVDRIAGQIPVSAELDQNTIDSEVAAVRAALGS